MARNIRFCSIRRKLILAFLSAFTPLAVLHFVWYTQHYESRKELALNSHAAFANSISSSVTTYIEGIVSSHETVARDIEKGVGDRTLNRSLKAMCDAHPGMVSTCIISTDGKVRCAYPPGSAPIAPGQLPEVMELAKGPPLCVRGESDSKTKTCYFIVASMAFPQGEQPVVVRSVLKAECLTNLIPLQQYYNGHVAIIDAGGRALLESLPAQEMPFEPNWKRYSFIRKALNGRDAPIPSFHPFKGVKLLGHAAPVRKIRWVVAALDTEDEVMEPLQYDRRWFAVSIVVTVIGVILMLVLGNNIAAPIKRLSRGAAAVAVGDFRKRIDIHTGDELQSLAESFNTMAESLDYHDQELTNKTAALEGLSRVAHTVTSSLDPDEVLKSLVRVTSELMNAQACAIFLVDERGKLTIRQSHNLSEKFIQSLDLSLGQGCPGKAIETRKWTTCKDIQTQGDLAHREPAMAEGLASVLSAPLLAGSTAFGALTIWTSIPSDFTQLQIDIMCSIASYASTAIQNAQMYVKEYNIAETLQSSLISDIPSELLGLSFGSRYLPARLDDSRVGGDFFDVFRLPGGLVGVVIADVSGKGLQAAIYTAMCKYMLRGFAFDQPESPASCFSRLSKVLHHFASDLFFVTAFYAVIDTKTWTMTYANAGHPPPILITHYGKQQIMLYKTGVPLGFESNSNYSEQTEKLEPDSCVFLYTDGIIEARGNQGMLDLEGLQDLLFSVADCGPQEIADSVCAAVSDYSKDRLRDDVAVIVFAQTAKPGNTEPKADFQAAGSV